MIFSEDVFIRTAIFALGVCGFFVAKHIRKHKVSGTVLTCPIGFDCHAVVHSDYSKFLGMPVEMLGMVYYAFVSFLYLFFIFISSAMPPVLVMFAIVVSKIAFLFSLYLIYVQIFILRKGCSWCIVSAFISVAIFILTIHGYDSSFIPQIFLK